MFILQLSLGRAFYRPLLYPCTLFISPTPPFPTSPMDQVSSKPYSKHSIRLSKLSMNMCVCVSVEDNCPLIPPNNSNSSNSSGVSNIYSEGNELTVSILGIALMFLLVAYTR